MNRRSFFQKIMAGIGALVGYRVLPKAKAATGGYLLPADVPDDLKTAISELPEVKSGEHIIEFLPSDCTDAWCTTLFWNGNEFIQWRHLPYEEDEIIIDWVRRISKSTDAKTDKTTD